MLKPQTSFTVAYCSNVNATAEFYKLIGAEIKSQDQNEVVVKLGDHEIHFVLETTEPFAEYQYVTLPEHRGQGILFYVETDGIDGLYTQLTASQAKVMSPAKPNLWQAKEFLVEDPDGLKIVFYQTLD